MPRRGGSRRSGCCSHRWTSDTSSKATGRTEGCEDAAMALTEAKWQKGARLADMLDLVIDRGASDRKLRLFATACGRRSRHQFADPEEAVEEREVTELAERFADDLATARQLAA